MTMLLEAESPLGITRSLPALKEAGVGPRRLALTTYRGSRNPRPSRGERIAWTEVLERLASHTIRDQKDGAAFSLVQLKPGTARANENVVAHSAVVLDIDDGTPLESITRQIKQYEFLAVSTHNNTRDHPKYRLIFPLSRDVSPAYWPQTWQLANQLIGGHADKSTKDPSRLYYFPSCPVERKGEAFCRHNPGIWLNPDELGDSAAFNSVAAPEIGSYNHPFIAGIELPPDEDRVCRDGERTNHLTSLIGHWIAEGLSLEDCIVRAQAWNARNDPPLKDEKVKSTCESIWRTHHRRQEVPPVPPGTTGDLVTMDDAAALALVMHAPTEDNVSQLFERQYSGKLRYCKVWGSWLSWDGTRWRPERTDLAFDFARTQARAANPSGKTTTAKAAFARGVEAFARASRRFATESEQWDRDEFLLNTPGGTVDLRTGEIRPHDQADYSTKSTSVTPRAGPTPVFDRFMDEITCGDKSLVKYHLEALGAMLSGARVDHWLLFWVGSGRNGKNTLGDLVAEIFGDYAKTIPTETLMSTNIQGHPTEIANLRGVRLAVSSEVAEGAYWNETRIKSLTGDTTLTGRLMRGDFFEFPRAHKHLIYGNNRPQLRVVDDAIRARMHIVPFPATFNDELGNRDPLMGEKLRAEAPQVLARLIEGHRQWVSNGFKLTPCDAVRRETQDYLNTQSTPALWVEERCEVIENDNRPTNLLPRGGELYTSYSLFKKLRGEQPITMTRWGEWMGKRFTKVTSNGIRYRGIGLKPPGTEHYGTPAGLSPFSVTIQ